MVNREIAINTAKAFVKDCKNKGIDFYKVLLFGSAVTDKMHEWSDIDLLIVSDQFNENVFDNLKLYSNVNIKYPLIETHPYPTRYFLQGDDFIDQVQKQSIEIV